MSRDEYWLRKRELALCGELNALLAYLGKFPGNISRFCSIYLSQTHSTPSLGSPSYHDVFLEEHVACSKVQRHLCKMAAHIKASAVLPQLIRSKATVQYHIPRTRPKKFYIPQFILSPEKFSQTVGQRWLLATDPLMPPYPYGKNNRFPEADLGLYGGATIQSGNKISKGRNKGKTLRKWFPNVKIETFKSDALKKSLSIPVTARVKRTIEKCGGLDYYVIGKQPARIKELGLLGWKLRWMVMNSEKMKSLPEAQRNTLGLPTREKLEETFEQAWADPGKRAKMIAQQTQKWEALRQKDLKFKQHWQELLIGDKAKETEVPDISTLHLHSPESLNLPEKVISK